MLVRHPSAILLLVQLLGVLIYPYTEGNSAGRVVFEAFGVTVLALAIWVVRPSPTPTSIAVALAITGSALSIADAIHPSVTLQLIAAICHALFYFWAAVNLMIYMLADARITTDELFAVGATFTLVAWGFAYLFVMVQTLQPGCFLTPFSPLPQRSWSELLFLSFTNLSSTGISDIAPVTTQARSVVMIEQLAGLGYVALFVSRLVGLTLSRQVARRQAEAGDAGTDE
ncbi:ion channel [Microlunatus ginsengisoli]|uniref:Ion channel n=2 Tax=Microlunatus ginsengisoli TaxID=363863 RepID=A0ABP7A1Y9_9ACTN